MTLRHEFVLLAMQENANIAELCRRYGISRDIGYKWIRRFQEGGPGALADRSRGPHTSPHKTPAHVEKAVIHARREHPGWGARKIRSWLARRLDRFGLVEADLPAPSTITAILHRGGLIAEEDSAKRVPFTRFERSRPNELWQMDFKGDFLLQSGTRCFPLTVLDDHSRFSLSLQACRDQQHQTVKDQLTSIFRRYGLPDQMLMDNGPPWGSGARTEQGRPYFSGLTAWMVRLGITVAHGRPFHPQTQGKDERFHRTLDAELLRYVRLRDHDEAQRRFDHYRRLYNTERPHEALAMQTPAERYEVSRRAFPETLLPVEYGPDDEVRKVDARAVIRFRGHSYKVGKAFRGESVALRPTMSDGLYVVYYCHQKIREIDLRHADPID